MSHRGNFRYSPLSKEEDQLDDPRPRRRQPLGDLRFMYQPEDRVPWRSVALAMVLLLGGSVFLVISHLIFSSHMGGDTAQGYGFLIIGILIFLPGFYETRIAYYSWRGREGYRFSQIPAY